MRKFLLFCKMIKIEHSVFALPFAFIGCFLANKSWPGWEKFLLITIAMVGIRSFAMAMNRIIDLRFDKINPRTSTRPLVTGELNLFHAYIFSLVFAILFVLSCYFLNKLCFYLSFFALVWAGMYSYSKRFTPLCHFWLGSVLAMAPLGGWLGIDPKFSPVAVCFAFGVLFWVAGFDILYSIQDIEFDQKQGLFSIPSRLGIPASLWISNLCHMVCAIFFFLGGWLGDLQYWYYVAWAVVTLILVIEHLIVSEHRLDKINMAFFTLNAFVSCMLFLGVIGDIFIK